MNNKDNYICENCKEKVNVLYFEKSLKKWLCEKCSFEEYNEGIKKMEEIFKKDKKRKKENERKDI